MIRFVLKPVIGEDLQDNAEDRYLRRDSSFYEITCEIQPLPDNGRDMMIELCKRDQKAKKLIYKYIDRGVSIHLVGGMRSTHGDFEVSGKFSEHDFDKISGKWEQPEYEDCEPPHFEIIYPTLDPIKNNGRPPPTRTVLLLNVDGVLNVVNPDPTTYDQKVRIMGGEGNRLFDVRYRVKVLEAITRWGKVARIMWLTSWSERARYRLAPALGLPDFEVAPFYKQEVEKSLEIGSMGCPPPERLIWIDDEMNDYLKVYAWIFGKRCDELGVDRLFLVPEPHLGLTDEDISKIDAFLEGRNKKITSKSRYEERNWDFSVYAFLILFACIIFFLQSL